MGKTYDFAMRNMDGNPLLYALKKERGWKFKSEKDWDEIWRCIEDIADKFASMYPIGLTIIIPSGNPLNRMIGEMIERKVKNATIVDDVLTKITTEEVMDIVMTKGSQFIRFYGNSTEQALRQLKTYLDAMDRERGGYFARHYVRDPRMRDVINMTIKLSDDAVTRYAKSIDGKDVLLVDDSISRGQTIKEACSILKENYEPKSITVLTLFSPLKKI